MARCIQSGKSGSGITSPEKKKIIGAAKRLIPSPEIVQSRHTVIKAMRDAARSNPANADKTKSPAAEIDAGIFRPKKSPATIKMGMDRINSGAARPLSARVNQTEYRFRGRVIS